MMYFTFGIFDVLIAYFLAYFTFQHHSMLSLHLYDYVRRRVAHVIRVDFVFIRVTCIHILLLYTVWCDLLFGVWYICIYTLFMIDVLILTICVCKLRSWIRCNYCDYNRTHHVIILLYYRVNSTIPVHYKLPMVRSVLMLIVVRGLLNLDGINPIDFTLLLRCPSLRWTMWF